MNASDSLNTGKSRGSGGAAMRLPATGARVSNTYATCPPQGYNRGKPRLIPHDAGGGHPSPAKGAIRWRMGMRRHMQVEGQRGRGNAPAGDRRTGE